MAIIGANNLSKSFGERVLFEGVSFELPDKARTGLVGVNGCGKTTLMRILAGQQQADEGNVFLARDIQLGVMEQYSTYDDERPLLDETMTVFRHLMDMEAELEQLNESISSGSDDIEKLVLRQHNLHEGYQQGGGLTFRSRTQSTLRGIGFSEDDLRLPMRALSGGQKSKAQMAKLLLSGADILLLDEPTNHLDIQATEWLENHLAAFPGAIIVISHDRYFLDKVTDKTMELENGKLTIYGGNYSRYQQLKQEAREQLERLYANQQKEIQRVEGIIKEFRRWNKEKSIKRAESREKQLAKFKANAVQLERQPDKIRFQLSAGSRGGDDVMEIAGLAKSFDKPLFSNLNMRVRKGDRVFLIGPNGIGKSTLFRIITGEQQPDEGELRFGTGILPGYYDQAQSGLHPSNTVLSEIWNEFPQMEQAQVRSALAAFLFRGDDVSKSISALSGGERARVALLKLMLSKANLLLLDEPTNHLDTPSREALEDALEQYDGSMIIITHDRYLINRLAQRIYDMDGVSATEYIGNYDDYLRAQDRDELPSGDSQPAPNTQPLPQAQSIAEKQTGQGGEAYKQRKERDSNMRKMQGKLERLEQRIEDMQQQIERDEQLMADEKIASDYVESLRIAKQVEDARVALELAEQEWLDISEQLEQMR